jgi:hypothetical protein
MNDSAKVASIFFGVTVGPLLVALMLGGIGFGIYWLDTHKADVPSEFWTWIIGMLAVFFLGSILLCLLCFRVHPREAFQDLSGGNTDATLVADIAAAEEAVCKLITRVDGFLQNDVGAAGQKDPGLVSDAQSRARAGVDMVACSADASGEAAHRITRLEETLRSFTGPELQRTYDTAMKCEGFQGTALQPPPSLRDRLTAVQATLQDQQKRLLAPIDQKTEDLHRGIASDCDKRRGSAHMAAGGAKT